MFDWNFLKYSVKIIYAIISVSGDSEMMHRGILIKMPYFMSKYFNILYSILILASNKLLLANCNIPLNTCTKY